MHAVKVSYARLFHQNETKLSNPQGEFPSQLWSAAIDVCDCNIFNTIDNLGRH